MKLQTLALALSLFVGAAHAQDTLTSVPVPDVSKELELFEVAEGFEVNLFAADPMVANPIHMNWDPEGRLWVAGSAVYPHILPGQPASDTITVLEDTDGDGVADKSTIFAEGLFIPTGILPGDGGVYVANSTELLHLKDTDGDGHADETRVVLSGFGTEDTHHILHSPRWGYDGLLYMNQSIYIHSHVETPHGVRRLNAGGIWQYRPETMELEVFARGFVNPWGHHFDEWGQSFATDGAYGHGINYVFPGAAYVTAYQMPRVLDGLNSGQPKHCGLEILSGRHIPEDWRGTMITHDFRGHRVCRFRVTDENGIFTSVEQPEVLKTSHVSFRPVDVKMGPDGAIYVADWYNPIIQHGEVDFRDPRRDHEHGRIWRITAKGRPLVDAPNFANASEEELLDLLQTPERWNRVHAKRELKSRETDTALAAVREAESNLDPATDNFENERIQILWTYQTLDIVNKPLLEAVLASKDYRARAAAVRVLSQWKSRLDDEVTYVDTLAKLVSDEHPRVRLEAVRALARVESAEAADAAMAAMALPMDRFVEYALWTTMREMKSHWLPAIDGGDLAFTKDNGRLLYALRSLLSSESVPHLLAMYHSADLTPEQQRDALNGIADHGSPSDLGAAAAYLLKNESMDAKERVAQLKQLERIASRRNVKPTGDLNIVVSLVDNAPTDLRIAAIDAASTWNIEGARDAIFALAQDAETQGPIRNAAIDGLASIGGEQALAIATELAGEGHDNDVRGRAVRSLLRLSVDVAIPQAITLLSQDLESNPSSLYRAILQTEGASIKMAEALADATLPRETAKIGERTISSSGRAEPELLAAIRTAGGMGEALTELSPERMAELVNAVRANGNAARGEAHYRALDCAQCHAIAGAGSNLGPDMTSIGGSAQPDYLIESMLFPSKAIKEGFHSLVVDTTDFETFSGIKTGQTDTELILRSATEPEIRIPIDSIESQKDGGSLMPTGLTDALLEDEFIDLIAYLSSLGRDPKYSAGTGRHVRTWRTLAATPEAIDYLYEATPEAALKPHEAFEWIPVYSRITGELPRTLAPSLGHRYWTTSYSFLKFNIEAESAGKVAFDIQPVEGTRLWANGKPIDMDEVTLVDIAAGTTECVLILDRAEAKGDVNIQFVDDARSNTSAQFVGGR